MAWAISNRLVQTSSKPEFIHGPPPLGFPGLPEYLLASSAPVISIRIPRDPLDILLRSRSLLLWQRSEAKVWLHNLNLGEQLLGLRGLDAWVDDHIITWHPVDWGGDLVLVTGLERVEHAEDLGSVAAGRSWVGEDQTDGLLWVDDEDAADGEGDALGVDVGGILVVDPAPVISAKCPYLIYPSCNSLTCRMPKRPGAACRR